MAGLDLIILTSTRPEIANLGFNKSEVDDSTVTLIWHFFSTKQNSKKRILRYPGLDRPKSDDLPKNFGNDCNK